MTTYITKLKDIKRNWHLIDLKGKILGRTASDIAQLLMGKHKVYFSPNLDCGDYVVALNSALVKVTGKKVKQKQYISHSGYPGGFKMVSFSQQLEKDPKKIIRWAVKNMLPKNKLQDRRLARLKIFSGEKHTFEDKFNKSA